MIQLLLSITVMAVCIDAPYPDSKVVTSFSLDWTTHKRSAQGSDNFQLTWSDDDNLYGAWGDGGGFGNSKRVGLGVARIEGPTNDYKGFNVWGGKPSENAARFDGKSWGMISIDGILYMWVVPDKPPGKKHRNHYEYIELASSNNHGATWTKASWKFLESENVTVPTFLNFGKDNTGVPIRFGNYAYSYFIRPQSPTLQQRGPHGVRLIVHKPGIIYLARVHKRDIMVSKSKHEFFCGLDTKGNPRWGKLSKKRPVFEDKNGTGWCMSASYNPFLKRIILCTEHGKSSQGTIGLFDAPNPWGPWTTIKYYEHANPFGVTRKGSSLPWKSNVFFMAFATKWLDGNKFTLNFTGAGSGKNNDSFNTVQGTFGNGK